MNRPDEVAPRPRLPHEPRCPRFDCGALDLRVILGRERQDADLRHHCLEPAAKLERVYPSWEAEIEQDDVRPKLGGRLEQCRSIRGAADEFARLGQ